MHSSPCQRECPCTAPLGSRSSCFPAPRVVRAGCTPHISKCRVNSGLAYGAHTAPQEPHGHPATARGQILRISCAQGFAEVVDFPMTQTHLQAPGRSTAAPPVPCTPCPSAELGPRAAARGQARQPGPSSGHQPGRRLLAGEGRGAGPSGCGRQRSGDSATIPLCWLPAGADGAG